MIDLTSFTTIIVVIVVLYLISSIKILREYERGVIFRFGRLLPQPKGPGIILVFAPIDRIVRVSLRIDTLEVPSQDVITRDNVTVKVNAVIYFRVVDPRLAVVEVSNFLYATSQLAQTTLRSVLGEAQARHQGLRRHQGAALGGVQDAVGGGPVDGPCTRGDGPVLERRSGVGDELLGLAAGERDPGDAAECVGPVEVVGVEGEAAERGGGRAGVAGEDHHGWQAPATQAPPRQSWPHAPQFCGSVAGVTTVPAHESVVLGPAGAAWEQPVSSGAAAARAHPAKERRRQHDDGRIIGRAYLVTPGVRNRSQHRAGSAFGRLRG